MEGKFKIPNFMKDVYLASSPFIEMGILMLSISFYEKNPSICLSGLVIGLSHMIFRRIYENKDHIEEEEDFIKEAYFRGYEDAKRGLEDPQKGFDIWETEE